jgi:DNA end-binding protein Ku
VPERDDDALAGVAEARPFWSGTITFGLVSIPVNLMAATRGQRVSLRMVSEEGTPLRRRYFSQADDRPLEWDEIVRGYEIEKDSFVVVDDDELERLAPERTRDIDLRVFVPGDQVDPRHFERAYYLTPAGSSTKAYRLLAQVMEETGRAGIATFVMRAKEYLVAILAENGILRAETLRFADEVRSPEEVGLPEFEKPKPVQIKRMEKAIAALAQPRLKKEELEDRSAARMEALVKRKLKKGEGVVRYTEPDDEGAGESREVIDLMEMLQRSLSGAGESAGSGSKKRSYAKKGAAKKTAAKKSSAKKSSAKKGPAKKGPAKKRKSAAK